MQHILTCTTEELALLVTLCGYPSVAKSIAEASVGEKTEQQWAAILETAAHQLMAKQYWDYEREQLDQIPLSDEMQQFIHTYVKSTYMLRCSNSPNNNVLLFHYVENNAPWIVHVIDRDIIHEFSYIPQEDIASIMGAYYDYNNNSLDIGRSFSISDEAFDLLHNREQVETVRQISKFSSQEESVFDIFLQDLNECNWTLNNISLFSIPETEEPALMNIVFFMSSSAGVWIVEYTEHPTKPVLIKLSAISEWKELLNNIGEIEFA